MGVKNRKHHRDGSVLFPEQISEYCTKMKVFRTTRICNHDFRLLLFFLKKKATQGAWQTCRLLALADLLLQLSHWSRWQRRFRGWWQRFDVAPSRLLKVWELCKIRSVRSILGIGSRRLWRLWRLRCRSWSQTSQTKWCYKLSIQKIHFTTFQRVTSGFDLLLEHLFAVV